MASSKFIWTGVNLIRLATPESLHDKLSRLIDNRILSRQAITLSSEYRLDKLVTVLGR